MKLPDLTAPHQNIAPYKYQIFSPPKPHSAFGSYILQIAPIAGLSWVKAIGKTIITNSFGVHLISEWEEMEHKLKKVYGAFSTRDILMTDSIWAEPQDWMLSLHHKERYLSSCWDRESAAVLPNGLKAIYLSANALDGDSGYISLEYLFENDQASDSEIAALEDEAL